MAEGDVFDRAGRRYAGELELLRVAAEAEIADWSALAEAEAKKSLPIAAKPDPVADARAAMWELVRILSRTQPLDLADPARSKVKDAWFVRYTPLFKAWFEIVYGAPSATGRTRWRGKPLLDKLQAAIQLSQPLFKLLTTRGGDATIESLEGFLYPLIADLEYEGVTTQKELRDKSYGASRVTFQDQPTPVTLEDFWATVSTWPSQRMEISLSAGHTPIGGAGKGDRFDISQKEQREVLWTNGGSGVFYKRDGIIYAQSGKGFRHDVIWGVFTVAGQNATGAMILAQMMVDVALSFTPWGKVWDVISAIDALRQGDWTDAALSFAPDAVGSVAKKQRPFRVAAKGMAVAADVGKQVAMKKVRYVGRGGYVVKGTGGAKDQLLSGVWLVGDPVGPQGKTSYRFYDDTGRKWRDVDYSDGRQYIQCTVCKTGQAGQKVAHSAAVKEIMAELPAAYKGAKLDPKAIREVVASYDGWGDAVVERMLESCARHPDHIRLAKEYLALAPKVAGIKSAAGFQYAMEVFMDTTLNSKRMIESTLYELKWAAAHADDIDILAVPHYKEGWLGTHKGMDALKKGNHAFELKRYNFNSDYYKANPGLAASEVIRQAKSRLKLDPTIIPPQTALSQGDVRSVTIVFDTSRGKMPPAFEKKLRAAAARATKADPFKRPVKIEFWPQ